MTWTAQHFFIMQLEPFHFQKRARNKNCPCLNIEGGAILCFVFKANSVYLIDVFKRPNTYLTLLLLNKVQVPSRNSKVEHPVLFDFTFDIYPESIPQYAGQTMAAVLIQKTPQPIIGIQKATFLCEVLSFTDYISTVEDFRMFPAVSCTKN